MKKIIGVAITFLMVATLLLPVNQANALEKIDLELFKQGIDSKEVVGVFVELDSPTVVMHETFGGKTIMPAKELMRQDNISAKATLSRISAFQKKHISDLESVAPNAEVLSTYQYAFNGYYIKTPLCNLEAIAKMPQVKRMFAVSKKQFYRTRSRALLGAEKVWSQVKDPAGKLVDGSGVLVAVTDTGLDYTHQDFGAQKTPIGSKVVISRDLGENDNDCQEDDRGRTYHGTACASLVAANVSENVKTKVKELGMAPKAVLAGYKISKYSQVYSEDIISDQAVMMSWEWSIKDKVQVSSNSYGSPGGKHEMEQQQLNCALAGVTVVVANGNEGSPGPCYFYTIPQGDVAASNSVIGVGATDDLEASSLQVFSCPDKTFEKTRINGYWGDPSQIITTANVPYEIVDCDYGKSSDFRSKDVKNKLALISLGPANSLGKNTMTGNEKVANAKAAGAKAVIMYNNDYGAMKETYSSSKESIPVFNITVMDGFSLTDQIYYGIERNDEGYASKQNQVTVCFSTYASKGAIADFSSNGPTAKGFLKPDVCAPGVGIHAAVAKSIKSFIKDEYFDDFGGTSAACPIVAGCAALIKQGRPEWSPFEVKRALMNTATMLRRSDGLYYYPLTVQGMGRVDVQRAITTQTLIQPPSASLMTDGTGTRIADPPEEWVTPNLRDKIPGDALKSTIPLKIYNYSKKPQTYKTSYEINSSDPSLLDVSLTSLEVTIPASGADPGVVWLGLNVKTKGIFTNRFNDVIVWLVNTETGEKIHMGVCVYNNDYAHGGLYNQFLCNLKTDKLTFSPNGDGVDEKVEISYEVTNGSLTFDYTLPCYKNIVEALCFWMDDENSDHWACIKVIDFSDLGPGKFTWDGKDIFGKYVLPDGKWNIGISVKCQYLNSKNRVQTGYLGYRNLGYIGVTGSSVSPPSTLSTYVMPLEPGVGQEFQIGLYLSKVDNVQGISFDLNIPGAANLLSYTGFKKGNLIPEDQEKSFFEVEYDKENEQVHVAISKEGSQISGSGWLIYLKFVALEANYIDLSISNFKLAVPGKSGKLTNKKGFTRNAEIQIKKEAYSPADFNQDGVVDAKDRQIIQKSLGSADGEPSYNWRCDLNYDRAVNGEDFSIFARSYKSR